MHSESLRTSTFNAAICRSSCPGDRAMFESGFTCSSLIGMFQSIETLAEQARPAVYCRSLHIEAELPWQDSTSKSPWPQVGTAFDTGSALNAGSSAYPSDS